MKFYRPQAELTGKRLSANTLASFMAAQAIEDPAQIAANVEMPAALLRFLLRNRAISYWSRPENGWLKSDAFNEHYKLTPEGLRKVENRLAGKATAQSVSAESVLEELAVIKGLVKAEPLALLEFSVPDEQPNEPPPNLLPGEVIDPGEYFEGATKQVFVATTERNTAAREECIRRHGLNCSVCSFNFEKRYGAIGKGFIHVHHLLPLSDINESYAVNPTEDLRPVCPNCHAMLHAGSEVLSIAELKARLNDG